MNFIKQWGHEIAIVGVAIWAAIGTDGQQGLINLAYNWTSHHAKLAAGIAAASVVVARFRPSPAAPPAATK